MVRGKETTTNESLKSKNGSKEIVTQYWGIQSGGVLLDNIVYDPYRIKDIGIEEVKQFDKFKAMDDKEVDEMISAIKSYTQVIFSCFNRQQNMA